MPAHWAKSRARLADLPAAQHQIHDLLDVGHSILVLRQAHGPAKDRSLRRHKNICRVFYQAKGHTTLLEYFAPPGLIERSFELGETTGVQLNELVI